MAKRTPVSRLEIDSISTKGIASPVETYVRPAEIQVQKSPLSIFVDALAPAVKAKQDKELEIKLKREREIESFRLQQKNQQISHQAAKSFAKIKQDYANNEDMYHQQPTSTIVDSINKHISDYDSLMEKADTDPLLRDKYKYLMNDLTVKFVADFTAGKRKYEIGKQNEDIYEAFLNQEIVVDGSGKDGVQAIIDLLNNNAKVHLIKDAKGKMKPDFNRINAILVKAADAKAKSNPDNVLYLAAEKLGLLTNPKYAKTMNDLKGKRDKKLLKTNEQTTMKNSVTFSLENETLLDPIITDSKGKRRKMTEVEKSDYILTSKPYGKKFLDYTPTEQAYYYKKVGFVPLQVRNGVKLGVPFMSGSFKESVETNETIKQSLNQYKLFTGIGITPSQLGLNAEEIMKFEALDLLVNKEAKQGQYIKYDVENEAGDLATTLEYTAPNHNSAAVTISQKFDDDLLPELDEKFSRKVKSEMGKWIGKDLTDVPSSSIILKQIAKNARFFMALGNKEEASIKRAFDIANKNNPIVKTGTGESYRFTNLAAGLSNIGAPEDVLNKMNKILMNSKPLQTFVKDSTGLKANEFDIAIKADTVNEALVRLIVINKKKGSDDFNIELPILGTLDKQDILNDPKILYNMLTEQMKKAKLPENALKPSLLYSSIEGEEVRFNLDAQYTYNRFGDEVDYQKVGEDFYRIKDDGTFAKEPASNLIKELLEKAAAGEKIAPVTKKTSPTTIEDKQSSLLEKLNPINTANAATLNNTEGEFTEVSNQLTGDQVNIEGNNIEDKTANMIATQEGFSSTPYKDGSDKSVGFGFFLPALEDDEKALIKDVNNVTKEEGVAVLKLKVQKIGNYLDKEIQGFRNLPEKAQSAVISMGYQLGAPNLKGTWKKFWSALNEASEYAEGSVEQGLALGKAQFNMLFNVAKDGSVTATKWATQTAERALEMANDVGSATTETVEAVASGITNSIIPSAHANTNVPEEKILKIGEQPTADMVSDIAIAVNPVEAAAKYMGISEKESEGAEAVKGFFENIVGDWNPDNETVLDFAGNKAWCAAFLTQVLRDSGFDTDSLVSTDKFKQLRASSYANVGTSVDINQAKAGDIMVKYHTDEEKKKYKAAFGHVGIVYKVDGDQVWFIGGNSGDKVKMASYNHKDKKIDIRRLTKAKDIKTESVPALLDLKLQGQITASNLKNWLKQTKIAELLDMDN